MELFAICCTTCQARLKVRDTAAIGKILACPKCGSMVQVAAPAGWHPPAPEAINKIAAEPATGSTIVDKRFIEGTGAKSGGPIAAGKAAQAPSGPASSAQAQAPANPAPAVAPPATFANPATPTPLSSANPALAPAGPTATTAPTGAFAASAVTAITLTASVGAASVPPTPVDPKNVPPAPATASGPSFASRLLARVSEHRLLLLTSPVAVMVLALLAWIMFRPGGSGTEQTAAAPQSQTAPAAENPDAELATAQAEQKDEAAAKLADAAAAAAPAGQEAGDEMPAADETANDAADVVGNRPDNANRDFADLAKDPTTNEPAGAADGADAPAANAPEMADKVARVPAGPGNLTRPIVPFGAAPAGDGLPAAPVEADNAAEADVAGDMVVGQESMPPVDVVSRLADPLPSVQFKRVSLVDFCDFLSRLSTIPITLDVDALELVNVHPSDQVSISAESTTVGDALTDLLAKRGLMFLVEGQQLIVTSPDRKAARPATVTYDVHDLAPNGGDDLAQLATMVAQFVVPASWQENGGKGRVKAADGSLVIEQDLFVQRDVAIFLDKLRQTRALPVKGNLKPEDVALKSRYSRAKANLDKVVTANFGLETPLVEVLAWLGRATGMRILIDEASLSHAGLWSRGPAKVVADHQPLHEVLPALLKPIGMTYRVVDERTLQVFAQQSQADRYEFEIYPMVDLLAARLEPKEILPRIRGQFDAASWTDGGGLGMLEFDEAGKCLLVVQSPEAQIRLENMLLRAKPASRPAP